MGRLVGNFRAFASSECPMLISQNTDHRNRRPHAIPTQHKMRNLISFGARCYKLAMPSDCRLVSTSFVLGNIEVSRAVRDEFSRDGA